MTQLTADELAQQGQAMREMREEAGIGELQMAVALDVDPKTIRNWETGKTNPGRIGVMAYETVTRKSLRSLRRRSLSCNSVEQLDLFSPSPMAADVRSGGMLWELSDRSSVDISMSARNAAKLLEKLLVA